MLRPMHKLANLGGHTSRQVPAAAPPTHTICVRFRNLRWEVSLDGRTRPLIDWLCTRERAVEHALELGRELVSKPGRELIRIVVEGPGGFEHALA
ncbi:hypothetical protein AKJ09_00856 [Labilithrix luteola]|uniref:Uncharacterized protein n=1 Tax=Labilithrix luteola TaxID=1391654 RepID=A0A0K1PKZ3_9BACT|nr:hypothetical protein [Labilithrix luteola]AKU94192.1 hypothetical protein AKJ09_00856 [Labilithrix luteola]